MKSASPALAAHIAQPLTTLASCVKVTRTDGQVFRFTDHDADLTVAGDGTYSADAGYRRTAIQVSDGFGPDTLDLEGVLTAGGVSETDLRDGLFDSAAAEVFLVNWADPAQGTLRLIRGFIGQVRIRRTGYVAEIVSLVHRLRTQVGDVYQPDCRVDLGSAACGVSLAGFTVAGTVSGAVNNGEFLDSSRGEADGWFDLGLLTWTSGANVGLKMEVKAYLQATGQFKLMLPMPRAIAIGDQYSLFAGCDKKLGTCRDKFNNIINFRGEPHVPGELEIKRFPDAP